MGLFDFFSSRKSLEDVVRVGKLRAARRILLKGATQTDIEACIGPAVHSRLPMVELLVQHGANVNHQNRDTGRTPLHHAASCGYRDIAMFLIENGADVNAIDHEGRTPLDLTLEMDIISDSFVYAGATRQLPEMPIRQFLVYARTSYARDSVHSDYLAEHRGKTSVAELLKAYGTRRGRVRIPEGLLFQLRLRYPTTSVDELTRQFMIDLIESGTDPFEDMHTLILGEACQKYPEIIAMARQKFGHAGPSRPSTKAEKPHQAGRTEHVITNEEVEKLTEELLKIGQSGGGGVGEWLYMGYQRSRYKGGYHHNGLELRQDGPNEVVTDLRTIEIGKRLCEIGGIELMRANYARIAGKLSLLSIGALADAWEGIGGWSSKEEYPPDY